MNESLTASKDKMSDRSSFNVFYDTHVRISLRQKCDLKVQLLPEIILQRPQTLLLCLVSGLVVKDARLLYVSACPIHLTQIGKKVPSPCERGEFLLQDSGTTGMPAVVK